MSRSKYEQVHDGEWWLFQEGRSNRRCKIACCDCGLVHVFKIRIRKGKIEMQVSPERRQVDPDSPDRFDDEDAVDDAEGARGAEIVGDGFGNAR